MLVGASETMDVWFKSPPYIGHDSFAAANAVTLSSIASARRIAKTLLVRFMSETPFVFRKDSFLTYSRCSRETALRQDICHSRNGSAVNTKFITRTTDTIPLPALPLRLRRGPRYPSLGALVSPRRFPRTVCILAVAIQLSMRFILLGRAKARWFLERGFPGSVFPRRAGALRHADAQSACLRGMRRTSICKSVRFRLAYIIIGVKLFPARLRAIPPASALPAAFPFSQLSLPPAADGTASAGVGIPA